jgi:O-antigen/teichoic acid export membrane protein
MNAERRSPLIWSYAPRPLRALASGRSFWALGDQATLSLGNFLTNIFLLRNLPKQELGEYTIVLSVILFLNNLHTSLVTYPLSITAATGDEELLRRRTRRSIGLTLLLAIPFGAGLAVAAGGVSGLAIVPWVLAALIFWQIQETLRRALLARLQHLRALPGDAISYLGQAAAVWIVARHGEISVSHAFAIVAITSALAALVQAIQLRILARPAATASRLPPPEHQPLDLPNPDPLLDRDGESAVVHCGFIPEDVPGTFTDQAFEHWSLGRWVLLASLLSLISVYATPWVLYHFHGAGEVAAYSALVTLLGVTNPVLTSMANLIVPAVAKIKQERGLSAARNSAVHYALQGAALLLPYFAILVIAPAWVMRMACGAHSPYLAYAHLLRPLVAVYVLIYIVQVSVGFLNGLGKSRWTFFGQFANAGANLLVCLPLAAGVGLLGVIWGGLFPMIAQLLVILYFVRLALRPQGLEKRLRVSADVDIRGVPEGAS